MRTCLSFWLINKRYLLISVIIKFTGNSKYIFLGIKNKLKRFLIVLDIVKH